jgi:flagellar basal body rod protein FlgG
MLRGIYNVASAMEMSARNHEIVSENIVHAATPGYRRQGLLYDATAATAAQQAENTTASARQTARNARTFQYFEPGPLQETKNPLDVAVTGNGFFGVNGPNGPLYTRNGGFEMGAGGQLVTRGGGYPVRGTNGPINFPPGTRSITISRDGTVSANGTAIGKLELTTFEKPDTLRRVGTTLFEGDSPQTPPPGTVRVEQGYREGSNVQPVQEMVSLVMGMRHYEAAAKALQAMSDAVAQNTRSQAA